MQSGCIFFVFTASIIISFLTNQVASESLEYLSNSSDTLCILRFSLCRNIVQICSGASILLTAFIVPSLVSIFLFFVARGLSMQLFCNEHKRKTNDNSNSPDIFRSHKKT